MNTNENRAYLGYWLRRYLLDYLPCVRNLSKNTQNSYRDTFRLLLPYVSEKARIKVDKLKVEDITVDRAKGFLLSLEHERKCSVSTRNQRLAALLSLAKYVASMSPELVEWCRLIHTIPTKRGDKTQVTYLEKDEMDALLEAPDKNTELGRRDYAILLFMYNIGTRAEETVSLCINDVFIPPSRSKGTPLVTIKGKGNKTRCCPLWKNTVEELKLLIKGRNPKDPLFLNRYGDRMTRHGIYDLVTRYAEQIGAQHPSVKSKNVTPHVIRHTTATHLLQAGVDINTIRAWLGHVSVNTTNIYAEVNLETKAKALVKCQMPNTKIPKKRWRDDKNLMDFLDNL